MTNQPFTDEVVLEKIASLPQGLHILQPDAYTWVKKVTDYDPRNVDTYLKKMSGLGGLDMSVLVMAEMGLFHPFTDAEHLTKSKLMRTNFDPPNNHVRRSHGISKIAQEEYRAKIIKRGGKVRDDLLEIIHAYVQSERPKEVSWLIGSVDDIVEENGELFLIDYKTPALSQYQEAMTEDVGLHHTIQAHHYLLLAKLSDIPVQKMRLFHFSTEEWDGPEREVAYDPEIEKKIIQVGQKYWNEYIMQGKIAPKLMIDAPASWDEIEIKSNEKELKAKISANELIGNSSQQDPENFELAPPNTQSLREKLQEVGFKIFGQALLKSAAENGRDEWTKSLREYVPMKALPYDTSRIDLGPVRLKASWKYNEKVLLETIHGILGLLGNSNEENARFLDSENFFVPNQYSAEALVKILKDKKGIDVDKDSDFIPAITTDRHLRIETLVDLLKDLSRRIDQDVDWEEIIDYNASTLDVELIRVPLTGPSRELREQTLRRIGKEASSSITPIIRDHILKSEQEKRNLTQKASKKKPKNLSLGPK